ncbi:MAG: hypothetical protein OXF02_02130 [Simkaniaceae bacterium]|nr:hypothetical protein [Simkaniaceae bacterium]
MWLAFNKLTIRSFTMAMQSDPVSDCRKPLVDRSTNGGSRYGASTMEGTAETTHSLKARIALRINSHRKTTLAVAVITGMILGGVVPGAIVGAVIAGLLIFACSRVRVEKSEAEEERAREARVWKEARLVIENTDPLIARIDGAQERIERTIEYMAKRNAQEEARNR